MSLLFVIFIAIITFSLLTSTLWNPTVRKSFSSSQTARIRLGELEGALQMFAFDVGRYPTTQEGLLALLENPGNTSWHGPYLKDNAKALDIIREFTYRFPSTTGKEFDLSIKDK